MSSEPQTDHLPEPPEEGGERHGREIIAEYVRHLDSSPGVYRMLDREGQVLYVGKARNLKRRVESYARPHGHSARIGRMIFATREMMFLTTKTETEALLLEQNLIKQLKPRYNVLLRDDKSFPSIKVSTDQDYPMIEKHRGARKGPGAFFGPFASARAVNRTLHQLERIFRLRSCSDAMFASRTRPCLQHQIARCTAPCVGRISKEDYQASVQDALRFLKGESTQIQADLARDMQAASAAMEYETAAALRDRIAALTEVQAAQTINPKGVAEADIIALHEESGVACVQVFFIRAHQNWGNRAYYPKTGSGAEAPEILEAFITQFYANKEPPRLLLLSHEVENPDLVEALLTTRREAKVQLLVPQRGEKAALVEDAKRNAREALAQQMAGAMTHRKLMAGLAEAFGLEGPLRRVEVYDNSHIQGQHALGAMIVAGEEGFLKSQYRKYNFTKEEAASGDDFGMMRLMLTRRLSRLKEEGAPRPDLLLIDGGAGQINAVQEVLDTLGLEIAAIGVAKGVERNAGREEFYRPGARPFALSHHDPVLYFIQRLRDEAHRFVIGAHRKKRSKAIGATPLDEIAGVGPGRKRALLAHFGSAKAVSRAGLSDLRAVNGISAALAQVIYDHFHEKG